MNFSSRNVWFVGVFSMIKVYPDYVVNRHILVMDLMVDALNKDSGLDYIDHTKLMEQSDTEMHDS